MEAIFSSALRRAQGSWNNRFCRGKRPLPVIKICRDSGFKYMEEGKVHPRISWDSARKRKAEFRIFLPPFDGTRIQTGVWIEANLVKNNG